MSFEKALQFFWISNIGTEAESAAGRRSRWWVIAFIPSFALTWNLKPEIGTVAAVFVMTWKGRVWGSEQRTAEISIFAERMAPAAEM